MVRWIEIDYGYGSYWDPNRFCPFSGLFEGLSGMASDFALLHSWADVPRGHGFCVKDCDRVDFSMIPQRHVLVREHYMFHRTLPEERNGRRLSSYVYEEGVCRFFSEAEAAGKFVYVPYFNLSSSYGKASAWHDLVHDFQCLVCKDFEHEFYFDYYANGKDRALAALRRQISLDDLL